MNQVKRKIWREPIVWMLAAGPLIVVVAGLVTWKIASDSPDRVENTAKLEAAGASVTNPGTPQSMTPARNARNHASTATTSKPPAP
jgi:uncharacterized protein